jgi:hypothetical protein
VRERGEWVATGTAQVAGGMGTRSRGCSSHARARSDAWSRGLRGGDTSTQRM